MMKHERITESVMILLVLCSYFFTLGFAETPIFSPSKVTLNFSEGAVIGTKKLLDTANPKEDIKSYRILNDDTRSFRLQETRSSSRISYLHLETTKKLDREKISKFKLNVSALSTSGSQGFLDLIVNVLDINDNPPIFDKREYTLSVNESINVGSDLISVKATDADTNKNGRVTYSLSREFENHFSLNRQSGLIKTKSRLSCSYKTAQCDLPCLETKVCNILVYAKDSGTPQQSSQTVVKVRLLHQANDHIPKINFRYLPDQSKPYASVEEKALANTSVAAITVNDQDQGRHGETSVEIVRGNERGFFELESYGGSLYVLRVSSRARFKEAPSKTYNLTIKASDHGIPPKFSLKALIVKVKEINDHEPMFLSDNYESVIDEDAPVGSSVVILTAKDKDSKTIFYSFAEDNNWFTIHSTSGLVTTKRPLDRETKARFSLRVNARDGLTHYKEAWTILDVFVNDVNDEIPSFEFGNFIVANVSEDASVSVPFLTVKAKDEDQGSNGTIRYSIKGGNEFEIDPEHGKISTKVTLDREVQEKHILYIVAQDQGPIVSFSSTATLIVNVLDINDNSPVFYPQKYIFFMRNDNQIKVTAMDKDGGLNSEISFDWDGDIPPGIELNKNTGTITKKSSHLHPVLSTYSIIAIDGGGRKSLNKAQVSLKYNEMQPFKILQKLDYEFSLTENSGLDSFSKQNREVGTVLTVSPEVKLEIIDGDNEGTFSITSGKIITNQMIDRETKEIYDLRILAETDENYAIASIKIRIYDLNDNSPQIKEESPIIINVDKNAPVGLYMHKIEVTDADEGDNGKLFFQIIKNPNYGLFTILPHSGILVLNQSLTSNKKDNFELRVSVSDLGEPRMSEDIDVIIRVTKTNDHAPVFDFNHYEISVPESTLVNTRVLSLIAYDLDSSPSGILYSILDGNSDKFGIFPDGQLYLKETLDREEVAYYSVTVQATDNEKTPRSSTTTVVIYVTDENDNPPIFNKKNYVFYLHENEDEETLVGRITASDKDIDRNAELSYYFVSSTITEYFYIDEVSGFITSKTKIDRETLIRQTGQDFFQFDVQVQDNGVTRLTDTASVSVIIIDRNDNSPIFNERVYEAEISEEAPLNTEILIIHAEDIDKDENGRVKYEIIEPENDFFQIDENTGSITLISKLDRETKEYHLLTILARDGGTPFLSAKTKIRIAVIDENDNSPRFSEEKMELTLSEATKIGEKVYEFRATDADAGKNGRIKYSLRAGNQRNVFHLDAYTGILTLSRELDYESINEFDLSVSATDFGIPALTGMTSVKIMVHDENDNAPAFPSTVILIPVKEGISIGSQIYKIEAIDPDSGENGLFKFGFEEPSSFFEINVETGVITTVAELDREEREFYELTVTATDLGIPSLTSKKDITIKIDDINDMSPEIKSLNTALILPGTRPDTIIMQVKAEDGDSNLNGLVTYELSEKSEYFSLERHSGKLILKKELTPSMKEFVLTVIAQDEAVRSARRSATGTITIVIGRDNPGPSFTREIYEASVKENSPKGTYIGTVSMIEGEDIEYFVVESLSQKGNERDLLTINKRSGEVRTSRILDREIEGDKISLSIVALIGDNAMSGCKMEVSLIDENDSAPKFDEESTNIEISEGFLPGHNLGFIRAVDLDKDTKLTYTLGLFTQSFMKIDNETGRLTLLQSIDREMYSSIDVIVMASDGEHTTKWKKKIKVKDVNDNPPQFPTSHFSFDILETAERGAIIGRIEALDPDEDKNGEIVYRLISEWGSSTFSLDPTSGVLTLSGSLDYEEIQHYILEVSASDGGNPILTTTATVYVNVKDINDNAPEIEKVLYEMSIKEDVPIGQSIVQIVASDKDSPENTNIVFTLEESIKDTFKVSEDGTITTKTILDRETIPFYTFTVRVRDSDSERYQLTATTVVQITVLDVNDEAPSFKNSKYNGAITASVPENSPPNTPIVTIETYDGDEGKNAEIRYFLDDSHLGKFSVGRIDGVLRTGIPLDREEKDSYLLTVTAKDGGSPTLSSRVDVRVNVADVNDNEPEFSPKHYSASVKENASIGMEIVITSANDLDFGIYGKLRYSIISGDSTEDFAIGEYSGILKVNKKLDYERKNNYELTIQAEDGGESSTTKYDTASVTIVILDTNDNAPVFIHSPYIARILENDVVKGAIYRLNARDKDDPPNNSIEYALRNNHHDLFTIDSSSGDIFMKGTVDREVGDAVLTLELIATDSGTPRLTSTGTLSIVVEDVNDNSPEFENDIYHFQIEENSKVGTKVERLQAHDRDLGVNALISYTLLDPSNSFEVNEKTGIISTISELDREKTSEYHLTLIAKDSSPFNPMSGETKIVIFVLDINDNKPVFEVRDSSDFFIPPNIVTGDFVFGVFASDIDEGENGQISFRLVGKDSRHFSINRNNGVVTASNSFIPKFSYEITVIASDNGPPLNRLTSLQKFSIYLAEDLEVPKFNLGKIKDLEIPEDTPLGTVLWSVNALFLQSENDAVNYGIAGGNVGDSFGVNATRGNIFVRSSLDYENVKSYQLWIKAFFKTKPLFFKAILVRIKVTDINDNAPKFPSLLNKVRIPEGIYPPFEVLELNAIDVDEGANGDISYNLFEHNEDSIFTVDSESGLVMCEKELDREENDRYILKVVASDGGTPSLSSTATVLLTIEDVNDNAPKFSRLYSVNITENIRTGAVVLKVETDDKDSPANANVSYSFKSNPDNSFRINSSTGEISVVGTIDREIREEYALRVEATDGAWKLETVVTVTVQDENDNAPIFDESLYSFIYPFNRNRSIDKEFFVGKVHALDRDSPGANSALSYSLAHVSDYFAIGTHSGEITTKKILDYKGSNDGYAADNSYRIRVLATDAGTPPMSSECQVVITLIDGSNQPAKFKADEPNKEIAVPAGIPSGTLIYTLSAIDSDPSSKLNFEFASDNNIFSLDSSSGEIRINSDRNELIIGQTYDVKVSVDDGGIPLIKDYMNLRFVITDENLFTPEFQSPTTRIYIREDEAVGNTIVTLTAADKDNGINGYVEYDIVKGDPDGTFSIGRRDGRIIVEKILDYEKIPVYNILIQAKDMGFYSKSATSSVKIILHDVDDNRLFFDKSYYEASLKENSSPGTVVTQIIASDKDSPKHAQIQYSISNLGETRFSIDSHSGIVTSKTSFDFEEVPYVEFEVFANSSDFIARTKLRVNIEGENEFYPKFTRPVFQFAVSETSLSGSSIGRVEARDYDAGDDGKIYYFFVGSSNSAGFGIHSSTGEISVEKSLDRESQNRYVLTVLAKNRGSILGNDTDEAQVIIQVQDGNDPPVFGEKLYTAEISEDVSEGTKVTSVRAIDKDVRPRNSHFSYSLANSSNFAIGSSTGVITVSKKLDRETVSFYNLTVKAIDNGSPPATGTTMVRIFINDINDSPPILDKVSGHVKENSPPNSFVMSLSASDPDLPPNSGPFRFSLRENKYLSLDPESGIIRTKSILDRELVPYIEAIIRVEDSGRPPLSADYSLKITVSDENDNPSSPRNLSVFVANYEGTFPGGIIARVRPSDPDLRGNYRCKLLRGPESIFQMNKNCDIFAGRIQNGREYELTLEVNDGRHADVEVHVRLAFLSFSSFAVRESLVIRFYNATPDSVLSDLKDVSNDETRRVELLSISSLDDDHTSVDAYVILKESNLYRNKQDTKSYLQEVIHFENALLDYDPCLDEPCLNSGKCSSTKKFPNITSSITEAKDIIYNSPVLIQKINCVCTPEYAGTYCQIQKNPCHPNPCLQEGKCIVPNQDSSYQCLCPPLRGGNRCEKTQTDVCSPNPCLNGGSCQRGSGDDNFFCRCRPGYQGDRCERAVDSCLRNPCLNGGVCISQKPDYRCRCPDNFYGNRCELSTFGFDELSFATFPPLDANTNDISITFATTKGNALLIYNHGEVAGGRSDFLAVELVEGKPRFSWGAARTAVTVLELPRKVNNGRWYKVTATRNNRVASLSIEDCTESAEYCKLCQQDDSRCFTKDLGEAGTLVFGNNPMYLGGLKSEIPFLERPGQLSTDDFVGCIKTLIVNGNEKNFQKDTLNQTGISSTCKFDSPCRVGDECGRTGICLPLWSRHLCSCGREEILSKDCVESFSPFTLTEEAQVDFLPTRKFRRIQSLEVFYSGSSRWEKPKLDIFENVEDTNIAEISLSFRSLQDNSVVLTSQDVTGHSKVLIINGVLVYQSYGVGLPDINMTSGVIVNDGSWHSFKLKSNKKTLNLILDGSKVGYDVEYASAHNFLDKNIEKISLGLKDSEKGFRGCLTNFTINNELQSPFPPSSKDRPLLKVAVPLIQFKTDGCDLEVLQSTRESRAIDIGVALVIAFFVVLFTCFGCSCLAFRVRKWLTKKSLLRQKSEECGYNNRGADLNGESLGPASAARGSGVGGNDEPSREVLMMKSTSHGNKPDIIEADDIVLHPRSTHIHDPNPSFYDRIPEHYDLDNASSIAPSDIDVAYHYKAYRSGRKSSLPFKKKRVLPSNVQNTPLARLSPSSEISHNTPRILTLGDLSGKSLPPGLVNRGLSSPLSNMSRSSGGSRQKTTSSSSNKRTLTSENVARFNNKNSTLVSTMDMVVGTEVKKGNKSPPVRSTSSSSSSSSGANDDDDDSFTCSEYDYDEVVGDNPHPPGGAGVFTKLMDLENRNNGYFRDASDEEEDDEEETFNGSGIRSWESLLSWCPDYETFSGVFRDIAELPHNHCSLIMDGDCGRPNPLGERAGNNTEEEYI